MKKALAAVFGSIVLALILRIWIMSFGGGGSLIPSGPRSSPESSLTWPPPRVVNTSSSSFQLVEHAELCRRDWSHWTRAQRESHECKKTQFFILNQSIWSWISIQCIYIVLKKWLKGEFWVETSFEIYVKISSIWANKVLGIKQHQNVDYNFIQLWFPTPVPVSSLPESEWSGSLQGHIFENDISK